LAMISVRNLTKTFGRTTAVDDISFDVSSGEVLGFLGPNGAGKTTTMRILTCYLAPDSGSVTLAGLDIRDNSLEVRRRIGYLPENAPIYQDMDVVSYLGFVAEVRGISSFDTPGRIRKMVATCGLEQVLGRNIGELSKGYKQRVGLAQTLIHDPDILILDEPTTGLDPSQIIEIRELIKEATCSRVLIINEGRIAASGTPEELQAIAGGEDTVHVSISSGGDPADAKLAEIRSVASVGRVGEGSGGYVRYVVKVSGNRDVGEAIFRVAVDNNWKINELRRETLSLEDIFLRLTTKEG
jgi:ABC-2 type transport system ATP-binding protein